MEMFLLLRVEVFADVEGEEVEILHYYCYSILDYIVTNKKKHDGVDERKMNMLEVEM